MANGAGLLTRDDIITPNKSIVKVAIQMESWIELSALEYKEIWDRIYDEFNFEPNILNFPSFV